MKGEITIFWFRNDLRIQDNIALIEALKTGKDLMLIYIFDQRISNKRNIGSASKWWLHHSLISLQESLNGHLNLYKGTPEEIFEMILQEKNVKSIYCNKHYNDFGIKSDLEIEKYLKKRGIELFSFNSSLLWEPENILRSNGEYYKVFTHFYKKGCLGSKEPRKPRSCDLKGYDFIKDTKFSLPLESLELIPKIKWYTEIEKKWLIGEKNAMNKLHHFLKNKLTDYKKLRNYPSKDHTSKLSPHLRFGEISPHQIWEEAKKYNGIVPQEDIDCFLSEIAWREFSYYLLYHFPNLENRNFRNEFDDFEWIDNTELLEKWHKGETGYPIIDAGMRELWLTGYMHNRVRMITASFLVKNLLIDWRKGEEWFWDCLVDADLANNCASWQWVSGSGADAAPYFRIFNPTLQSSKFDENGEYIRKYVPEVQNLPAEHLFEIWNAPTGLLKKHGIELGKTYPIPIINLESSRKKALSNYQSLMKAKYKNKTD